MKTRAFLAFALCMVISSMAAAGVHSELVAVSTGTMAGGSSYFSMGPTNDAGGFSEFRHSTNVLSIGTTQYGFDSLMGVGGISRNQFLQIDAGGALFRERAGVSGVELVGEKDGPPVGGTVSQSAYGYSGLLYAGSAVSSSTDTAGGFASHTQIQGVGRVKIGAISYTMNAVPFVHPPGSEGGEPVHGGLHGEAGHGGFILRTSEMYRESYTFTGEVFVDYAVSFNPWTR